jgi:hypothetical protein
MNFTDPRKQGQIEVQWRNRPEEGLTDIAWHHYCYAKRDEAELFLRDQAPNSTHFEYRLNPKEASGG